MNKTFSLMFCAALVSLACLVSCDSGSGGGSLSGSRTIIDHTNFSASAIPASYLTAAKTLDVYFEHASVGQNVSDAIDSFAFAAADGTYSIGRASWITDDLNAIAQEIPDWYGTHDGFGDNHRGNPGFNRKLAGFVERLGQKGLASAIDVASFKFCYIDDGLGSYGTAQNALNAVAAEMEALEAAYPGVTFVWWTMPITRNGSELADAYNTLVRAYCAANGKYLLDIADIECHDPEGNKVTSAEGFESLYADYASDGEGHLNATGGARMAQAWWRALVAISGWN